MTKLTHNLGMKAVACFLVILSGLTSIISIITITFAGDCGFYADQPVPYAKTGQCAGTTYLYADRTMSWINSDVSISTLQERFAPDKTNFRFELFSKDGSQLLFTNIPQDSGPLVHIMDYRFSLYYDFLGSKTVNLAEGTANLLEDSVYEITFDSNHAVIYSDTGEEGTPLLDEPVLVTMRAYVTDPTRDRTTILVVEESKDVLAMEKIREYRGLYHVLHGTISPMNGISPDEINVKTLITRLMDSEVKEVIIATNATSDGEATAMYLARMIKPAGIKVTRLARGLAVGSDIEYADEITLSKAVENRLEI